MAPNDTTSLVFFRAGNVGSGVAERGTMLIVMPLISHEECDDFDVIHHLFHPHHIMIMNR